MWKDILKYGHNELTGQNALENKNKPNGNSATKKHMI